MIKVKTHNGNAEVELKGNGIDILADLSIINLTVLEKISSGNNAEMLVLLEGLFEVIEKAIKDGVKDGKQFN